jgi:hypothetical protein
MAFGYTFYLGNVGEARRLAPCSHLGKLQKRIKQGKEFGNSGFSETRPNLIAFLMDFIWGGLL